MQKHYFHALVASLGSGLEYFSFITFALQAQYLSLLFFPQDSAMQGILNTFLIFAVGSIVMVVGGLFFGYWGDRSGRKKAFSAAILLMTIATLGIGLLPSHWGIWSLALMVFFRILQGISQGAELPGAITFISEHAKAENRGLLCGLMFLGVGLGAGLATSVNVLTSHFLTFQEMLTFGWRIPFFAAVFLGLTGFILRQYTSETPIFLSMKKDSTKLEYRKILKGFCLVAFGAVLVSLGLYWPALFTTYYHFKPGEVFLSTMIAFIATAFLLPVFGHLGDRFGYHRIYTIGMLLSLTTLPFLFELLKTPTLSHLISFSLYYYLLIVILAGNYPVMLSLLFPPQTRYFSIALSYAGCYAVASFMPALASYLFLHTNQINYLLSIVMSIGFVSLLAGLSSGKIDQK